MENLWWSGLKVVGNVTVVGDYNLMENPSPRYKNQQTSDLTLHRSFLNMCDEQTPLVLLKSAGRNKNNNQKTLHTHPGVTAVEDSGFNQ